MFPSNQNTVIKEQENHPTASNTQYEEIDNYHKMYNISVWAYSIVLPGFW